MNTKKTIILLVSIIAILAGLILYGYFKTEPSEIKLLPKKGAKIFLEVPVFDFGTVIFGDVPEHNFVVKNIGDKDLEILRLSTSCGCTKAFINEEDKIISPGKSIKIRVTFDPAVHKDATDLGDLTRIIYIKSNDTDSPEIEAKIKANVIKK